MSRSPKTESEKSGRRVVTVTTTQLFTDLLGDGSRTAPPGFTEAMAAVLQFGKAFPRRVTHTREAIHRLSQLQWIVKRTWTLNADVGGSLRFGMGKDERVIELITLTESAYYIAFRLRGVIREIGDREHLSACRKFNPPGVRDVRNHLIEHTDQPTYMFATGGTDGPQLKPWERYRGKTFDRGLFANIDEFLEQLTQQLARVAVAKLQEKGAGP